MHTLQPLWFAAIIALFAGGCVTGTPFVNSSLDFNRGVLHRTVVQGDRELVEEALVSVFTERACQFARRRVLHSGASLLSFRMESERVAGSESRALVGAGSVLEKTRINYLSYGSVFYAEVSATGRDVVIELIGLPVVDGVTACPDLLRERDYRDCIARPPPDLVGESYSEWAASRYDVACDGRRESEIIAAVLAELGRKKWRDSYTRQPNGTFDQEVSGGRRNGLGGGE